MTDLAGLLRHLTPPSSDADLLDRFAQKRDELAFAELLHRHGPMVRAVCRRVLGPTPDADDAFQAAFLVLVRSAHRIGRRDQLAGWLAAVAWRTAKAARRRRLALATVERTVERLPERPCPIEEPRDWLPLFDAALHELPAIYREAVVLCELEGRSRSNAAQELGIAEGTLSSRLARARDLLRRRLQKYGFPLAVATALAPVAVPETLASATVALVRDPHLVPDAVRALIPKFMEGVIPMAVSTSWKVAAVAVLGVVAIGWRTDGPRASSQPPPAKPDDAVAVIHGDTTLTRQQFGEYLIRRHGADKLEAFVNLRIIETEAARKEIRVTDEEIDAALDADLKSLNMKREEFVAHTLKQFGQTLEGWREDVLRPRLLLMKLCGAEVRVEEADLRAEFEARYSPTVKAQIIAWSASDERNARSASAKARTDPAEFDRLAKWQASPSLSASAGRITLKSDDDSPVARVARKLQPGEVSELLLSEKQWVLVKMIERTPADPAHSFEAERNNLLKAAFDRKLQQAIPERFKQLREAAKPKLLPLE